MKQTEKKDVCQMVTERIIQQLEMGVIPWKQPWSGNEPRNLVTMRPYRGINLLLLTSLGYARNYFLTFNQVKFLGGMVRKGEKSHLIVFWKRVTTEDKQTGEKSIKPFLRYYLVFNVEQCDNIPPEKIPVVVSLRHHPVEACEDIVINMPLRPIIQDTDQEAYYMPSTDIVNVPNMKYFEDIESYYAVLFHELIHSTGHQSRLNRKEIVENPKYGSEFYSLEELTAEIGSCYLYTKAGITPLKMQNQVSYIKHWLDVLENDMRFIVYAAVQAQKASDFILNLKKEEIDEPAPEQEPELVEAEEVEDELPF
jgi:antirestriction protein ArdC